MSRLYCDPLHPIRHMSDDLDELSGGWRRAFSTARLTGKLGAKAASRMLRRKPADGAPDPDVAKAVARAKDLVERMGQLKGLVMKAGQIASYMPGSLPPEAQAVLADLQAKSTPMAWPKIEEVLRAELPAGAWFDSIDDTPFAAASIGQVHRAVHYGAPVAVKIQYPGVEDAIRSDLKMVGVLARMSSIGTKVDGGALAGELRERLLEECDYKREAELQRLFAKLLAEVPGARVPAVVGERSTGRVLTTAFVPDTPLPAFAAAAAQPEKDRAGHIIFRACFDLLWRHAIYNADPHPGNYLVAADGAVTFLDFGCTRRFEPDMILAWKRLARSILDGNQDGMADGFRTLGFVGKEKGFDWKFQYEAMRFMYRPFLEPGFRYDPEFVTKTFGVLMFDNPNRFRMAMPPAWLFLNRLQWGLNAVLAQLAATGPWRDIIEEMLASPLTPA
jgi:predicted unusual protein kinase regulating ubiquinone biosynthesis (AarF/ABC1/UbiB family)